MGARLMIIQLCNMPHLEEAVSSTGLANLLTNRMFSLSFNYIRIIIICHVHSVHTSFPHDKDL
jgi:hypothetical protein